MFFVHDHHRASQRWPEKHGYVTYAGEEGAVERLEILIARTSLKEQGHDGGGSGKERRQKTSVTESLADHEL